ncbi:hypothetical protein HJC23_000683 [Cyclotella cryptica]|uniref:Uncharacterized protein n=1 Tax=Cyclotella cryptica TaxID=29204 RepID=A0ABD3Q9X7_9STRA
MATNSNNSSSKNTSTTKCNTAFCDAQYPSTALQRLASMHSRVAQLVSENALQHKPWEEVHQSLLWAGGLQDLPNAIPG